VSGTLERTALYRVWGDGGLLLYIGVSNDFGRRWKEHAKQQPWWGEMRRLTADEWFGSRKEAEEAEQAAIKTERPKYNKRHLVPVAQKPKRAALAPAPEAPESIRLKPEMEPVRDGVERLRNGGGSVPYPYSLLSVRLPERDMTDADLSTMEGRLQAAEVFSDYERRARKMRSRLDERIASLLEDEADPDLHWAVPTFRYMRSGFESLVGDGNHLAAGKDAQTRAAAILRENAKLTRLIGDAMEAVAGVMTATVELEASASRPEPSSPAQRRGRVALPLDDLEASA
jgi:predicted GIY-YIG superfamily endonuclease